MHAARIETSPRLRRVLELLSDGRAKTTLEIVAGAGVCAVNSCIAELRANGYPVRCWREGDLWFYQLERSET
ncbi:MAG: hypothetical protein N2690_04020 [Rhodocyclaceae bacterium]|nr:hypothetical protein [Rhodocyclaceae bacterium]